MTAWGGQDGSGRFELKKWTRASKLLTDEGGAVVGLEFEVVGPPSAVKDGKPLGRGECVLAKPRGAEKRRA